MSKTAYRVVKDGAGFSLVGENGDRWDVGCPGSAAPYQLRRERPGRFILEAGSTKSGQNLLPASTTPLEPLGFPGNLYYLLLGDGSLYRIRRSDPRTPGFRLSSWETDGAYLVAHPEEEGWRVETTPAGEGIDATRELVILLAAVILDEERSSESVRDGEGRHYKEEQSS